MFRKILKITLEFCIYVVIVGAVVWGMPTYLSHKFNTKYPFAAITSGSMWPVLKTGDLVFIKHVAKEDIKLGDIVVWQNPAGNGFTIHRVVALATTTLTTKGDANFSEDTPVLYGAVIGRTLTRSAQPGVKPVRVPYLGYISMWSAGIQGTLANSGTVVYTASANKQP